MFLIDMDIELWRVIYDYDCLVEEVESLDEKSLIDECEEIYTNYDDERVCNILFEYWRNGNLTEDDRIYLKNYYVLCHSTLCVKA